MIGWFTENAGEVNDDLSNTLGTVPPKVSFPEGSNTWIMEGVFEYPANGVPILGLVVLTNITTVTGINRDLIIASRTGTVALSMYRPQSYTGFNLTGYKYKTALTDVTVDGTTYKRYKVTWELDRPAISDGADTDTKIRLLPTEGYSYTID